MRGSLCGVSALLWGASALAGVDLPPPNAPKTEQSWVQYGMAFASEGRARAGSICPKGATEPCILGSGAGLGLRIGRKDSRGWFLGGAYEFSKQDASNLLRLPILQQFRGEARYYPWPQQRLAPYLAGSLGPVLYGPEWGISTYGGGISIGGGADYETSQGVFLGVAALYRVMWLDGWRDRAGQDRPEGFAHFVAIELTLEVRTPIARW